MKASDFSGNWKLLRGIAVPMLMNLHAANADEMEPLSIGLLASALVAELGFARIGKEDAGIRARELDARRREDWTARESGRRESVHGVSSPHAKAAP